MSDWRRETAADVGWGNWEAQEAESAERDMTPTACRPGHHHMAPNRTGGGTCTWCNETIGADEL